MQRIIQKYQEGGSVKNQTEEALGYAAEGKKFAKEYTPPDISAKDAVKFVAEMTPIIGDAMAAKEVWNELQKEKVNWKMVGALAGAGAVGLVPFFGDAAGKLIKQGARKSLKSNKNLDAVATGVPQYKMDGNAPASVFDKTVTQEAVDFIKSGSTSQKDLLRIARDNGIVSGPSTGTMPAQVIAELGDRVRNQDFKVIQKNFNEGGTVQPSTATGLPAGGNAASAIANYMMGPMSANAATLSYTGGSEGVPDYHALALEQKKLREDAALIGLQSQIKNAGNTSSGEDKMEERNQPGGDLYKPFYNEYYDDSAGYDYSGADSSFQGYTSEREPLFSGGGADGVGNFGRVGDYFGGIKDSFVDLKDSVFSKNSGGPIGYNMGSMKKPVGYNMGTMNGPIGYNMGGVSQVARSMLPEEQIQQRQLQQAQFAESKNPLATIGNAMGMKVANKGMDAALGDKASKVALKAAMSQIPVVGPFLATLFG